MTKTKKIQTQKRAAGTNWPNENCWCNWACEAHHNGVKRDSHTNFLIDGTKLKSIIQEDVIPVNSSHYYALNSPLNDDIVISAYLEDGVIEAVEILDRKFYNRGAVASGIFAR